MTSTPLAQLPTTIDPSVRSHPDAVPDRSHADAVPDRSHSDAVADRSHSDAVADRSHSDAVPGSRPGLAATVSVEPWTDPMVENYGHDPRSAYAETFWLPVVGPSTAWMLRRFATGFDHSPDGYSIDCAQFSSELGLGRSLSRNAAFVRSVDRACKFGLAQRFQDQLYVRRMLPPLAPRHVRRIPERLRIVHEAWQHGRPTDSQALDRAKAIAAALLSTGASPNEAEQQLHRWGFDPALAWSAVAADH